MFYKSTIFGYNNRGPEWWNGLHEGLKNLWAQARVGSTPTSGTNILNVQSKRVGKSQPSISNTASDYIARESACRPSLALDRPDKS